MKCKEMITKPIYSSYLVNYKKLLPVLMLLTLISNTNRAQNYLPLIEEGKQWNEYGYLYPSLQWTDFYYFGNDTLINNIGYTKLLWNSNVSFDSLSLMGFIRENDNGEVYFVTAYKSKFASNQEYLLYNFSCAPGDTLDVFSWDGSGTCKIIIDSIKLVDYYGIQRQKYYYHNIFGSDDQFWVEGLGSSQGLLNTCMDMIDCNSGTSKF